MIHKSTVVAVPCCIDKHGGCDLQEIKVARFFGAHYAHASLIFLLINDFTAVLNDEILFFEIFIGKHAISSSTRPFDDVLSPLFSRNTLICTGV